jgi:disulfide bond formation protein DsbB
MHHIRKAKIEFLCNALELTGVIAILGLAFAIELINQELPCPLCLLQRVGLFLVATGVLLNLRFGSSPVHYAMIILSALFTSIVALSQVAIHVRTPGSGYGEPFLGLHLYTWAFVLSLAIILFTTIVMTLNQLNLQNRKHSKKLIKFSKVIIALTIILIVTNIIAAFFECGLSPCPKNPQKYIVLEDL